MVKSRSTRLGDICGIFDGPHATPNRVDEGPYFLNIASLGQGRLDLSKSDHVSPQEFTKWTRRVTPQENDLLFSYETRLGEAALMPPGVGACLGRRMALMRLDHEQVDSQYFLYYYLSPEMQKLIEARTIHGATVNRISLSTMAEWKVCLPSLPEQRAIAEVLGALDDKIAANTKLAQTLDELAKADLTEALLDADVVALGTVALVTMGSSPPGFSYNESGDGVVFYQGNRDFGVRFPRNRLWTTDPKRMADRGDVLMSVRAPVGEINLATESTCIGRGLASIRSSVGTPSTLFHTMTTLQNVWEPFESFGTVFGAINGKQLNQLQVSQVGVESQDQLERRLNGLDRLVESLHKENDQLAATRDTLLPQLMSGKLRVRDAEQLVEEVV